MTLKKKVTIFVSSLIVVVSVGSALSNYFSSLRVVEEQLTYSSMPLSLDNIYSEIQKNILEPNLVASMMANDTFLQQWMAQGERNVEQIAIYLEKIQQEYGLLTTFLVSDRTRRYYTQKGIIDEVQEGRPINAWYFRFKEANVTTEMNLDTNEKIDKSMILFINNKIFDASGSYLGACGTALKIDYIDAMLHRFLSKHNFNVYFTDASGALLLRNKELVAFDHINEEPSLYNVRHQLLDDTQRVISIDRKGVRYFVTTRYIPQLHVYVFVEARIDAFTKNFKRNLYYELALSLMVALIVLLAILYTINSYQKKIERLASHDALTSLANRRTFNLQFEIFFELSKRHGRELTVLFIDIDDFKTLNDNYGHMLGDEVLKMVSSILSQSMRKSDLVARWGGEEFAVLLHDTNKEDGYKIAEKIRHNIQTHTELKNFTGDAVTVSIGLTVLHADDTMDALLVRADSALYRAKREGKNMTVTIS